MAKYEWIPVQVDAIQFTGDNEEEVRKFTLDLLTCDACRERTRHVPITLPPGSWIVVEDGGHVQHVSSLADEAFARQFRPVDEQVH